MLSRSKIVIVSHMSELYGAPKSLIPIIKILMEYFDIHVITFGKEGLPQVLDEIGISYSVIPLVKYNRKSLISRIKRKIQNIWGDLYFTRYVKKHLIRIKPDLVYVNTVSRGAPIIAAKQLNIPVILHVRESILYFNKKTVIDRRRISAVVNIPRFYFTVSESTKKMIVSQGVTESAVSCVHSGIDLKAFLTDNSNRLDNVIGFVGNMTERKGIEEYINISKSIIDNNNQITSYVVGGDLNSVGFKERISKLISEEYSTNFVFTGKVSDVAKYYELISIFCLTSKEEPFARVLIEAMASELPVVAFDTGGVAELVEDGINGFIIPKGDVDLFIEKVELLLADKTLRKNMGAEGRKLVTENFKLSDYENRIRSIIISKLKEAIRGDS